MIYLTTPRYFRLFKVKKFLYIVGNLKLAIMDDFLLKDWIDVTIKREDSGLLFLLLFKDQPSSEKAMKMFSSNLFSLEIKKIEDKTGFFVRFTNAELDSLFLSNLNTTNYPPLGWIREDAPLYLSCGWKTSNAAFQMLRPFLKVNKLHLN